MLAHCNTRRKQQSERRHLFLRDTERRMAGSRVASFCVGSIGRDCQHAVSLAHTKCDCSVVRTGSLATRCAVRYWPRLHNARQSRSTPCPTPRSARPCACTATRQQSPRGQWLRRCSCARRVRTKRTAHAAMTRGWKLPFASAEEDDDAVDSAGYHTVSATVPRKSAPLYAAGRACRWAITERLTVTAASG